MFRFSVPYRHALFRTSVTLRSPQNSGAAQTSGSPGSTTSDPGLALDAEAIEKLKIAEEIGEKAFEENTEILKRMMLRGLRALVVGVIGFVAFAIAMKRRRKLEEAEAREQEPAQDDPTLRYLEEMRSIGFDVDGLEEELEAERKKKKQQVAKLTG